MIASRTFMRPAVLAAVVLLVVNDHVLKARYPGLLTGKLSDVAGMVFFPLLLAALCEQVGLRRGLRGVQIAVVVTGAAFVAFKLSASAADVYRVGLAALQWPVRAVRAMLAGGALPRLGRAHLTQDPTDLVALVALAVPLALARCTMLDVARRDSRRSRAARRPPPAARDPRRELPVGS